jgi:hypothetical protein
MVVMHRADLMAMVMVGTGLGHARAQGHNKRQGGDSGFHRYFSRDATSAPDRMIPRLRM